MCKKTKQLYQCCQILREKQASGPMRTSPKQATSLVVVKKKKEKWDHYTLHTHINIALNPEMCCIISLHLLLFLLLWSYFVLVPGLQNNMAYNTIGGSRKNKPKKPETTNIYKWLYRKTSPKSLIISGLGNCELYPSVFSDVGVYLHTERGSEIRSKVVTQDSRRGAF